MLNVVKLASVGIYKCDELAKMAFFRCPKNHLKFKVELQKLVWNMLSNIAFNTKKIVEIS